jgi:hypothetical protein
MKGKLTRNMYVNQKWVHCKDLVLEDLSKVTYLRYLPWTYIIWKVESTRLWVLEQICKDVSWGFVCSMLWSSHVWCALLCTTHTPFIHATISLRTLQISQAVDVSSDFCRHRSWNEFSAVASIHATCYLWRCMVGLALSAQMWQWERNPAEFQKVGFQPSLPVLLSCCDNLTLT